MSNYRSLLSRATEGTEAPTPGYLYIDLAKAANGNPSVCQDISTYLTRRLASKQNPNIKFKCAKVLGKLCDSVPRNAFRRVLAQDHEAIQAIKDAMNFRGNPDPVRGDTPNEKVRTAAKETLDAVYREAPTSETSVSVNTNGYGGVSSSYGNPPNAPSNPYNTNSRMQGIGNPMFQDPRLEPSAPTGFQGAVREAGEVIAGMIKDPLARGVNIPPEPQRMGTYGGPSYGKPPPGAADLVRQTGGQWTMASNRGPGAVDYQRSGTAPGTVGGSWGNANVATSIPQAPPPKTGNAVSDGTYEKNLVLELCPPGGMKATPPPDKLANFARAVPSLNPDLVCPILLDCLEEGQPWIIRAKALVGIETAISAGGDPYKAFLYACHEEIIPLTSHARAAIADPAKRVLILLGVDATASGSGGAVAAAPVAPPPNLMEFGDETTTSAPAPAASSMFGGMQVKSAAAPAAPPVAAPAAPPAPSLLDFEATPAAPAPSVDVFGATTTAAAPTAEATSMFGQLNVKGTGEAPATPTPAKTPAPSAFGFINGAESSEGAVEPPPRPSFDPLAMGSPSSSPAKKMTMSPEQMQAMIYQQQQMMMQQMRMNPQMQMAMMQQQQPMIPQQPVHPTPRMSGFSFAPKPAKKDDKKFDFVKDAMQTAGKK